MRVTTVFRGILSDWVGVESAEFELHEGTCYADLLSAIQKAYRHRMPDQLWNDEQNTFAKPVVAFSGEKQINSLKDSLSSGQEVKFFLLLAGG